MNIIDKITKHLQEAEKQNEQLLVAEVYKRGDDIFGWMRGASIDKWQRKSEDGKSRYEFRADVSIDIAGWRRKYAAHIRTNEGRMHFETRVANRIAAHVKALIADPEGRAVVRAEYDTAADGNVSIVVSIPADPPVESQ